MHILVISGKNSDSWTWKEQANMVKWSQVGRPILCCNDYFFDSCLHVVS